MTLQERINSFISTMKPIPLPPKCLVISDLHAGAGDNHDLLKGSGLEPAVLALLNYHLDKKYSLLVSEAYDIWRGFTLEAITKAHLGLYQALHSYEENGLLYWALGNHERDLLLRPEAFIFEGFDRKVFFDHGYFEDWPNDNGWKIGRACVRMADELGLDPETSPHPNNPERHKAVREMRQALADANPGWDFFWGHTHYFENIKNNHNDGSPISGKLTYYLIEEGEIIAKWG